jgi:hypothetical protein
MKMEKFLHGLKIKFGMILAKIKYPKAGYYTRLALASGIDMKEINSWVDNCYAWQFATEKEKYDLREATCQIEVSYWEEA